MWAERVNRTRERKKEKTGERNSLTLLLFDNFSLRLCVQRRKSEVSKCSAKSESETHGDGNGNFSFASAASPSYAFSCSRCKCRSCGSHVRQQVWTIGTYRSSSQHTKTVKRGAEEKIKKNTQVKWSEVKQLWKVSFRAKKISRKKKVKRRKIDSEREAVERTLIGLLPTLNLREGRKRDGEVVLQYFSELT